MSVLHEFHASVNLINITHTEKFSFTVSRENEAVTTLMAGHPKTFPAMRERRCILI